MIAHNTQVCLFLGKMNDGRGALFRPRDADLEELVPPNHFNCRSLIVPVVAGQAVSESEFITDEQVGRAKALADARFLTARGAWLAYAEQDTTR